VTGRFAGPRLALLVVATAAMCLAAAGWAEEPAAAAATGSGAGTSDAAQSPPRWAYSLAHDLMSPFCPGRTLAACPSPQAAELRQWILFQAVAGRTREDIEKSLYERYGDEILGAPRAAGWGLSAYLVPGLAFLVGGGLVFWVLRRLVGRGSAPPASAPAPPVSAPERPARVPRREAELERLVDEELSRL